MADKWEGRGESIDAPARNAEAVTPSDGSDLANYSRALYVGTGGAVTVDMVESGTSIAYANVASGTLLPIRVKRVRATGTDASDIVAIW